MRRLAILQRCILPGLLLSAALAPAPASAAPESFDIVGLRLGMTEQQARDALKAHNPQLKLSTKTLRYSYSDGLKQLQTEPELAEISASNTSGSQEIIILLFSHPPKPVRLVGVRRTATLPNPPTRDEMVQAVQQKYGPPAVLSLGDRLNPTASLTWAEPGKPQCWRTSKKQAAQFVVASPSFGVFQSFAARQRLGVAPADLSQCGATAHFLSKGDPVRTFTVQMTDTGPWLDALRATSDWVSKLEAEARKARIGAGNTPKF